MIIFASLNGIMEEQKTENKSKWKRLLKRFGFWGIVFFIVKGLISTAIILYSMYWVAKK